MDKRVTLCEHAGRLIEQSPATELTTRQYLSQHNVRIPQSFSLPQAKEEERSGSVKAQGGRQALSLGHAWRLAQLPADLLWAYAISSAAPAPENRPHIAIHPTMQVAASASLTGQLSFHNFGNNKTLACSLSVPGLVHVTALAWRESTLAVGYAEGRMALLNMDLASQHVKDSRLLSLLPLPAPSVACLDMAWLDRRFLAVATDKGLFLVDTTKQDPRNGSTRILSGNCTKLAVSSRFIAVNTSQGIYTLSYRYPLQVSEAARCTLHAASDLSFAGDRVLLYTLQDAPEVRTLQLTVSEESRPPLSKSLEKLSLKHLGTANNPTSLQVSGSRVLMSTGAWTGLAQLAIEPSRAIWREIGQIHAPLVDKDGEHANLVDAQPMTCLEKQADGSCGFACLWSTQQVTLLPTS